MGHTIDDQIHGDGSRSTRENGIIRSTPHTHTHTHTHTVHYIVTPCALLGLVTQVNGARRTINIHS